MGSLSFVTPDAGVVFAAACREPGAMLEDLRAMGGMNADEALSKLETETGVDVVHDLAGTLGGEMALALDGPVLPKPSWKLVLEVYDEATLQRTIERLVAEAARHQQAAGATELPSITAVKTAEGAAHVIDLGACRAAYAFQDGYMVACPSVPLLEAALRAQRTDVNITHAPGFRKLLPGGADPDVSLLVYQDLTSKLGELQQSAQSMLPEHVRLAVADAGSSLAYARASRDAIQFGLQTPDGGLSNGLAGFVRQHVLQALAAQSLAEAQVRAPHGPR